MFWENLCSKGESVYSEGGELSKAVDSSFGGLENMKKELSAKSIGVMGSGWGWLGYNVGTGELCTWHHLCTSFLLAIPFTNNLCCMNQF